MQQKSYPAGVDIAEGRAILFINMSAKTCSLETFDDYCASAASAAPLNERLFLCLSACKILSTGRH
jgi:hypothetical protein